MPPRVTATVTTKAGTFRLRHDHSDCTRQDTCHSRHYLHLQQRIRRHLSGAPSFLQWWRTINGDRFV